MGRIPCCDVKGSVRLGLWTTEEDNKLRSYIAQHGTRNWRLIPKNAAVREELPSPVVRWTKYLSPNLKHGDAEEEQTIIKLHSVVVGNRIPRRDKESVRRGPWTTEEDNKLRSYIAQHGTSNWCLIPKNAGLQRCGKTCRLRWTNYLRPGLKHGEFTDAEEQTIIKFHFMLGSQWSLISAQLPGRTGNDVRNLWNTKLTKKLVGMGIDPVTHKSIYLMALKANFATMQAPPQASVSSIQDSPAAKDEGSPPGSPPAPSTSAPARHKRDRRPNSRYAGTSWVKK